MKASFANDRQAGPGHGLLLILGETPEPGPCGVAIQRASDHAFLAAGSEWKSQKYFLPLEAAQAENGLAIAIGPDLTDQLATSETYRVILRDASGRESPASLRIDEIIYSPEPKADNAPAARDPAPEQTDEPAQAEAGFPGLQEPQGQVPESVLLPPLAPPTPETPRAENGVQAWKNRKAGFWIMAATIALGCVLLGIFLNSSRQGGEARPEHPAGANASEGSKTGAEVMVRRFFEEGSPGGAQAAMSLAAGIKGSNAAEQDALYRLYYYAAGQGDPGGLAAYARCLDPALPAWGSIQKDALRAWESYAAAHARGIDSATAMRRLRAWLEQEKERGNVQAGSWLMQIPKK